MQEGRFKARAASWGLGYTQNDKAQVAVELEVLDGDSAGERITWYGYFTDAAHERTFAALRTLGWEGDDLSDLTGLDKNEVSITVKDEEYESKWTLKVAWINPLGGVGLKKPMTPEQAKAFGAQMKGAAIASRGGGKPGAGESRKKPAPRRPPPDSAKLPDPGGSNLDDDIPF